MLCIYLIKGSIWIVPEKGISPHVLGEIVCLQFAYRIKFSLVVLKQIKQFAMQGEHDRNPLLKGIFLPY